MEIDRSMDRWDDESDVVVAGYGFAGANAAISAHDSGARVLLLEKARHFGGNSIVSGGGLALAKDPEKAAQYLSLLNAGNTPDDVIRRMAEGMVGLAGYLESLAAAVGVRIEYGKVGRLAIYPLAGGETLYSAKVATIEGFEGYPWAKGLRGGARLFKLVADNVARRDIQVRYSTAARRLIVDAAGQVIGLVAEREGREIRIKARRGVVLACGGFENNEQMRRQFFGTLPVYPLCTLTNTGDGILMAQKLGAALWHMWHFHGSYGFKFPEFPFAFRVSTENRSAGLMVVPWVLVDQRGRRFMDEYPRYLHDTAARGLEHFDAEAVDHPRLPSYMIFDDAGRRRGPIGRVIINDNDGDCPFYQWSQDNLAEIERGWVLQADTLEELAVRLRIDPSILSHTVGRWNDQCAAERDPDFGRLPESMMPIASPPFYAAPVWPIVSNTQGGPVHDTEQRIVDVFGKPIPRLYAAGELGSLFGYIYQAAGNVAECFIGGRIAGRNAAQEEAWSEEAS